MGRETAPLFFNKGEERRGGERTGTEWKGVEGKLRFGGFNRGWDRKGIGAEWRGADRIGPDGSGGEGNGKGKLRFGGFNINKGGIVLTIKQKIFHDERMVWDKRAGHEVPTKRKFNAPKKLGVGGRVPAGNDRYKLIIQRPVMVDYGDGVIRKETRCLNWKTISRYVRDRDGKCLKCGRKDKLEADHFHPRCYLWINWFFRVSRIQTLCAQCHTCLPSMKDRSKDWKKFCWLK